MQQIPKHPLLNPRLEKIASLVRPGRVLADVGTDHAFLPVYLVQLGICPKAYAGDMRVLPLERAKRTIERYGAGDRVQTVLSDGLEKMKNQEIEEIVIAGMGGDTIAGILERARFLKDTAADRQLLLQPMTKDDHLRHWLCLNGFEIEREEAVVDNGFVYTILQVRYRSGTIPCNALFKQVGKLAENKTEAARLFLERRLALIEKKYVGLLKSGRHYEKIQEMLQLREELSALLKGEEK